MRKLRNKIMLGAGATATISGAAVLVDAGSAHAAVIIVDPILLPLLHLLLIIPL
jgi:uncharacterized paraquat-inducible protein A